MAVRRLLITGEPATTMMKEAGYAQRRDTKELVLTDADNGVEFFYLRPRDVAVYVGAGTVDLGITGRDLLLDSGSTAREVMALGFARSTFRFAAPAGSMGSVADIDGPEALALVRKHKKAMKAAAKAAR